MKQINLTQGSPEWQAHRANCFNASDAPAMMGASRFTTRNDLLKRMAVGREEEVDANKQRLFDRGHRAEAAVRPKIEAAIGEDLFPATAVSDEHPRLSASFDGITMDETIVLEVKLWSETLASAVRAGEVEPHYYWQLEQQLLISGAEKAIFVASNEDASEYVCMDYRPIAGRREALLAGWAQFEKDLASYTHEETAPVAVATPMLDLPSVSVQISGTLDVLSNLPAFGSDLRAFIDGLNPAPESDQDFANAESEIKVLKRAEDELQSAEERALSQIAVVDEMRRTKAMLHKLARDTRLAREKLVKDRKDFVRAQIQSGAVAQITAHGAAIDTRLGGSYLPAIPNDVAGQMKGRKTMASLKDAAATAVAQWKIEADRVAGIIEKNLETLDANHEHRFLFNDKQSLVLKDPEAVAAIVAQRIAQHEADQKRQAEEAAEREREKIRAEEQAKAQAEAKAREAAERAEREKAEREARAKVEAEEAARITAEVQARKAAAQIEKAAEDFGGTGKVDVPVSAPAPAAAVEVARVEIAPKENPRPTDAQIALAVATAFNVDAETAIHWLRAMHPAALTALDVQQAA